MIGPCSRGTTRTTASPRCSSGPERWPRPCAASTGPRPRSGRPGPGRPACVNVVRIMLASRFSMWMAWGPELTFFCNDAYRRDTLGAKYPWALGRPAARGLGRDLARHRPAHRRRDEHRRGDLGRGPAAVPRAQRLPRGDLPHVLLQPARPTTTARSPGCSASSARTPSGSSARAGIAHAARPRRGARRSRRPRSRCCAAASTRRSRSDLADLPFALDLPVRTTAARPSSLAATGRRRRATRCADAADARRRVWPLGARCCTGGPSSSTTSPRAVRRPADRGVGAAAAAGRRRCRCGRQDAARRSASWSPGSTATARSTTSYRGFLELVAGQVAAGDRAARAPTRRERERAERAGRARPRQDRVLHQRQPRVPHPADAAARARPRTRSPTARTRCRPRSASGSRSSTATASGCCKLVNTLLDFSRIEAGAARRRSRPIDLAALHRRARRACSPSAIERRGLDARVDCAPLPEPVYVDREMWAKVVLNLLSNALKFTFEGSDHACALRAGGRRARCWRSPTPASASRRSELPHAVRALPPRRGRASRAATRARASAWRWSQELVAAARRHASASTSELGARQHVHRAPSRSARRTCRPTRSSTRPGTAPADAARTARRRSSPRPPAGCDRDARRAGRRRRRRPPARPRRRRQRRHARLRRAACSPTDYEVDDRRATARRRSRRRGAQPPDLVLTDVMMPGLDGFGLLARAARTTRRTRSVPVIMLSARAGEEATVEGLDAGADDYLVKPFSARELLARVRANLELDRSAARAPELERSRQLLDQAQRLAQVGSWEIDLRHRRAHGVGGVLPPARARPGSVVGDSTSAMGSPRPPRRPPTASGRLSTRLGGAGRSTTRCASRARRRDRSYRTIARGRARRRRRPRAACAAATRTSPTQREAEQALAAAAATREAAAPRAPIADELQRSLLPAARLRPRATCDRATYYRAGVEGTQVGGDWYDVDRARRRPHRAGASATSWAAGCGPRR